MSQSLQPFFDILGPFLLGQASHPETVERLYGDAARGRARRDAERLAIYGRFCRIHRKQALSLFEATRAAIVAAAGEPAWDAWVERYFVAHPMHHFELNHNAEGFPAFLAEAIAAGEPALPPFVAELADLEWCEWQVRVAPDAPADAGHDGQDLRDPARDRGPLRLASTVDLRPYRYDLVGWLDAEEEERPESPEARDSLVIFWRSRELTSRREPAQPSELLVIKALVEGLAIDEALAARVGLRWDALHETLADLHAAGIVLGWRAS
jgi:hypothetical protein